MAPSFFISTMAPPKTLDNMQDKSDRTCSTRSISISTVSSTIQTPSRTERKSVALDAASLGRLSRLPEQVVEAQLNQSDRGNSDGGDWKVKRSMQTQVLKSSFIRCIQEAAVVGLVKRLEPVEIVSNHHHQQQQQHAKDHETPTNSSRRRGNRASSLLDNHVRRSREQKARSWSSSAAVLKTFELQDELQKTWHQQSTTGTTTSTSNRSATTPPNRALRGSASFASPLPSPVLPRWRRRFSGMTRSKLRECLALEAADQAFERLWRLENESDTDLKIREGCSCVYCSNNPTPYQTQEYQRLSKVCYFPPPLDLVEDEEEEDDDIISDEEEAVVKEKELIRKSLPTPVIPSLATLYAAGSKTTTTTTMDDDEDDDDDCPAGGIVGVKRAFIQRILPQVATKACDRALRLQKKGQAHSVTDKCRCTYCGTASPRQTRRYQRLEGRKVPTPITRYQYFSSAEVEPSSSPSSNASVSSAVARPPPPPPQTISTTTKSHQQHQPRSLTPPPPSSLRKSVLGTPKRCSSTSSTPTTTSSALGRRPSSAIRNVARHYNQKNGTPPPPPWVSPLANRKHINYSHHQEQTGTPSSPSGVVTSFLSIEDDPSILYQQQDVDDEDDLVNTTSAPTKRRTKSTTTHIHKQTRSKTKRKSKHKRKSISNKSQTLDGDIDEEMMLKDALSALVIH
jgi:hypothetical protein